jgi:hypothetical protein
MKDQRQSSTGDDPENGRQLRMSLSTVTRWAKNGWLTTSVGASGQRVYDVLHAVSVMPRPDERE